MNLRLNTTQIADLKRRLIRAETRRIKNDAEKVAQECADRRMGKRCILELRPRQAVELLILLSLAKGRHADRLRRCVYYGIISAARRSPSRWKRLKNLPEELDQWMKFSTVKENAEGGLDARRA